MRPLRKTQWFPAIIWTGVIVYLCGCSGNHSALNPAGIQANRIAHLWWMFFYVTVAVYMIVLLFLMIGAARRKNSEHITMEPVLITSTSHERGLRLVVGSAVGVSVAILFLLLITDFFTGRAMSVVPGGNPLTIKIIGHQWWWDITYEDEQAPSLTVNTANEMHIPLGQPVRLKLDSSDVIHSFWVPNLHGKKDLVPGHPTTALLRADKLGVYTGQCAEFCGYQHAHMRLRVTVDSPETFKEWLSEQRKEARQPQSESEKRGQEVFMHSQCIMCHRIQGSDAMARNGPDLTHFASHARIASSSFPHERANLRQWILDPQKLKPGVHMPMNTLSRADLDALLDYLESLQ